MTDHAAVFVVRAKPHGVDREDQFLSGIASLGFPGIGQLQNLGKAEILNRLRTPFEGDSLAATQIANFVALQPGAILLSPSYRTRAIHVFSVIGNYRYVAEWDNDETGNPHTLAVKLLATLERDVFSEAIQSALLSARKPVTNFKKYSDEISHLIQQRIEQNVQSDGIRSNKNVVNAKEGLRVVNVDVTPEMERWIEKQVASGMYSSPSEVVRAGLRNLMRDGGMPGFKG